MAYMGNTKTVQSLRVAQRPSACLSARVKFDLEILLLMCP